jgi:DNA repair protein RadD
MSREFKKEFAQELRLRPYQERIKLKAIDLLFVLGLNVLLYLATGGGKTEVASAIALEAKKRGMNSVFVVHRNELVRQTKKRFEKYGLKVGVIQHGAKQIEDADIYILSIGSFANRKEIVKSLNFDLVIIDEAHNHFNRRAYALYQMYKDTDTVFLGLSATPFLEKRWSEKKWQDIPQFWLGDESKPIYKDYVVDEKPYRNYYFKSFGYLYHEMIVEIMPSELKEAGYLTHCEILVYGLFSSGGYYVDESGDFDDSEIARVFTDPSFLEHMAEQYLLVPRKPNGRRRQGLAFCISIEHSQKLTEVLNNNGIKAAHLDCNTPKKIRNQIYSDYEKYLIDVICSVDVVSEGFDMPQAEVGLMCRPTGSLIKLVQQLGRLLRPFPGKEDCLILDQANNSMDIKSRYLALREKGFHPYDAVDISASTILNIYEPKLPDEIVERIARGEGVDKEVGILGKNGQINRPYSEHQAEMYIKYAEEEDWNEEQLKTKFMLNCLYPTNEAVWLVANHLKLPSEKVEKFYYECSLYSTEFMGLGFCRKSEEFLDKATIHRIKGMAKREYSRYNYVLQTQKIIPDFSPQNNDFLTQLVIAHKKSKDNSYYLFQVLRAKIEKDHQEQQTQESYQKLLRLFADYDILKRKYKRARSADKKIT